MRAYLVSLACLSVLLSGCLSSSDSVVHRDAESKIEVTDQKEVVVTDEVFPSWLVNSSFKVRLRTELVLDGSEEAGGIEQRSETNNRVVYKDGLHWRARRELSFDNTALEVRRTPLGKYIVTPTNRLVAAPYEISDNVWRQTLLYPFQLSNRWSFFNESDDWGEWFEKVRSLKEPLKNADGDEIRADVADSDKGRRLSIVFEGHMLHDGNTRVKVLSEWIIEYGIDVSIEDLDKQLTGGAG